MKNIKLKNIKVGGEIEVLECDIITYYNFIQKNNPSLAKKIGNPLKSHKSCVKVAQLIAEIIYYKTTFKENSNNNTSSKNPWWCDVLNCSPNDSINSIKKCYYTLAKKHHPDCGGDPKVFNRVYQAWMTAKYNDEKYN